MKVQLSLNKDQILFHQKIQMIYFNLMALMKFLKLAYKTFLVIFNRTTISPTFLEQKGVPQNPDANCAEVQNVPEVIL